jgi:hypothetical protein
MDSPGSNPAQVTRYYFMQQTRIFSAYRSLETTEARLVKGLWLFYSQPGKEGVGRTCQGTPLSPIC